jgi:multimeric flavodoxin WrbA
MKIVFVSTTTHSKNSTSKIISERIIELLKKNHDVDYIDADRLHIVKNLSCYSDGKRNCASPDAGKYRCWANKLSQENPSEYGGKDDMGIIYDAINWCDAIVWVTSARWGSHSALMQKIIERMNTLENRAVSYEEKNPLANKKCAVIVTGQHFKVQQIAYHLTETFNIFGFDVSPDNAFTWQKTWNALIEQEGDNNKEIKEYLDSKEGKNGIQKFIDLLTKAKE